MDKSPNAFRNISEVADWLGTPTHVLRFWETRFSQVRPVKRSGGRRYYRPSDMELLGGIKKLLREDKMTINRVRTILREEGKGYVAAMSPPLDGPATDAGGAPGGKAARPPAKGIAPARAPRILPAAPTAPAAPAARGKPEPRPEPRPGTLAAEIRRRLAAGARPDPAAAAPLVARLEALRDRMAEDG